MNAESKSTSHPRLISPVFARIAEEVRNIGANGFQVITHRQTANALHRGTTMNEQQLGTVVIGGSQTGLAVGYYLKQRGCRSSSWT